MAADISSSRFKIPPTGIAGRVATHGADSTGPYVGKPWRRDAVLAGNRQDQDKIDALAIRYSTGEISEDVFRASLKTLLNPDDIRFLVMTNQLAYRNSIAFKRGELS